MASAPPDFSVIIPTRDRPHYLRQAIASVLAQRQATFELLVVNDGAAQIPPHPDPRVRVLDNAQQGAVPARNLGVASAAGKRIAFLDDDDWWQDDHHLCYALASDAAFSFSDGEFIFMDGSPPVEFAFDASASTLAADNTILISGVSYLRSLHDALGTFDEALPYYWDWDWYLRVARSGIRLKRIATASACIRIHTENMSGEHQLEARRNNLNLLSHKHELGELQLKNHLSLVNRSA